MRPANENLPFPDYRSDALEAVTAAWQAACDTPATPESIVAAFETCLDQVTKATRHADILAALERLENLI
jgi:hypothetical protein